MKVFVSLVLLVLLLVAGGVGFLFSGVYNIAASEDHFPAVRWGLETLMENSVKNHAREVETGNYADADRKEGFRHYRDMCVHCHGAPGVRKQEFARGMTPEPPELEDEAEEWSPAELWWIVEHGIKMTGMPAFGKSHNDEDVWNIVAFVKDLPDLSEEEWQRLDRIVPKRPGGHQHGGPEHGEGGAPEGKESAAGTGDEGHH